MHETRAERCRGKGGQEPKRARTSRSWKRLGSGFSRRPSGRNQPYPHLDLSPEDPFRASGFQNGKIISWCYLEPLTYSGLPLPQPWPTQVLSGTPVPCWGS